jgi:outer membrane lipoprotein-sorting protein
MKKKVIILVMTVILLTVGLSGCTQQENEIENKQTLPPKTETLQDILSKAASIDSMYYEIALSMNMSTYGSQTATMKIWQKKPYFKEEITTHTAGITTTITVIQQPNGTYLYEPIQGKYVLTTNIPSFVTSLQYLDPLMIKDLINNQSLADFETDTIDGKQATLIDYSLSIPGDNQMTIQTWIWNEKGVPLKAYIDMAMDEFNMTMNFVFNNYSFIEIPDSTFNII